jgi:hypothetical protein
MFESGFPRVLAAANKLRIFVSYDRDHDGDLHDRLAEQASMGTSEFEISARSRARSPTDLWDEGLRREIRAADGLIVICGERTDCSERVGTELRIAQEEERPYFQLWGRRELMCTKPATAKAADSMYSWTSEILQSQIRTIHRAATRSSERMAELSWTKPTPKG